MIGSVFLYGKLLCNSKISGIAKSQHLADHHFGILFCSLPHGERVEKKN